MAIIQAGGSRLPFFCLGAGPMYRELARLLGPEQPFLGPVLPRPSELPSPIRIEDVAAHHVRIIRNAQPRGPYFLGGWCIDGLVAYEVAQQLRSMGEPVGLLVLFDTHFYSSGLVVIYGRVRSRAIKLARHLVGVIKGWRWGKISGNLRKQGARLGEHVRSSFGQRRNVEPNGGGGWMETAVQHRATEVYRPLPYDGRVLLLQRTMDHSRWTKARQDWGRLVRCGFEACDIPGNHQAMFEKPEVAFTAEKLGACLRKAQAATEAIEAPRDPSHTVQIDDLAIRRERVLNL